MAGWPAAGWMGGRPARCLAGYLAGRLAGQSVGLLACWLLGQLAGLLAAAGWLAHWPAGWSDWAQPAG